MQAGNRHKVSAGVCSASRPPKCTRLRFASDAAASRRATAGARGTGEESVNRTEHLIACLAEECNEVAQRATKALRFGLDEIQPEQNLTNFERLFAEFTDLTAVMGMLQEETNHRALVKLNDVATKQEKVRKYMDYAESQGALQPSPSPGSQEKKP